MLFTGLSIEAGVIIPSFELVEEVNVPAREDNVELLFIDKYVSARSKTFPVNIAL